MRHTKELSCNNRIFVWPAVCLCIVSVLLVGNSFGRRIHWESADLIYQPFEAPGYTSNCLTVDGQTILLSDWKAGESGRTVTIAVSRPIVEPAADEPIEGTEPTWPQDELTVALDAQAQVHLVAISTVEESQLVLRLERAENAPGLAQPLKVSIDLAWQGLRGTVAVNLLPYGELASQIPVQEETEVQTREFDTSLTAAQISDTLDPAQPQLFMKLNLATTADYIIRLTQNSAVLPMVRWSMDGGESYTLLYDSNEISFSYPYHDGWDGTLILDFSQALASGQVPMVMVEATGYPKQEARPVYKALPAPSDPIVRAASAPCTLKMNTTWGGAKLQLLQLQRLTIDPEGNAVYIDDSSVTASVTNQGILLQAPTEAQLPASGSYRIGVQWIWNDICIYEQMIYFFVNTN